MTTVLLVDDDPLQARVRKSALGRRFSQVQRSADVAEAFILVEDPAFVRQLGLVIVCLSRPGLGSPAFVTELTSRVPSVPVLVLGSAREEAASYQGANVRFLPRSAPAEQLVAVSSKMMQQYNARVA